MAACTVALLSTVAAPIRKKFSVIAVGDNDTTATIPHGISCPGANTGAQDAWAAANLQVTPVMTHAVARLSKWILTSVDRTNVVMTKTTTGGSGDAGVQLHVVVSAPVSMLDILP